MVKYLVTDALESCAEDLDFCNRFVDKGLIERLQFVRDRAFERVSYTEAVALLLACGQNFEIPVEYGLALQSEHERYLTEHHFRCPTTVYNYPKEIKPLYMRRNDDGKTVAAMDLLVPGIGEIVGGSQREERLEVLLANLREQGLEESAYDWYVDLAATAPCRTRASGSVSSVSSCSSRGWATSATSSPSPARRGRRSFEKTARIGQPWPPMSLIRDWAPTDDLAAHTRLLHEAYAPLAAQGLRFLASHQDEAMTQERLLEGWSFVLECDGIVIGTITLRGTDPKNECDWYRRPGCFRSASSRSAPITSARGWAAACCFTQRASPASGEPENSPSTRRKRRSTCGPGIPASDSARWRRFPGPRRITGAWSSPRRCRLSRSLPLPNQPLTSPARHRHRTGVAEHRLVLRSAGAERGALPHLEDLAVLAEEDQLAAGPLAKPAPQSVVPRNDLRSILARRPGVPCSPPRRARSCPSCSRTGACPRAREIVRRGKRGFPWSGKRSRKADRWRRSDGSRPRPVGPRSNGRACRRAPRCPQPKCSPPRRQRLISSRDSLARSAMQSPRRKGS